MHLLAWRPFAMAAAGTVLPWLGHAQDKPTLEPLDCRAGGRVMPYATIREADVMWERRVWRTIDLGDPLNTCYRVPQGKLPGCFSLFGLVRHGLLDEGAITAYDPGPLAQDDAFRTPLDKSAIRALFAELDTLPPEAIARFMIKEDWIFDRQRSMMHVRIIGIAPMTEVRGGDGELRGYRPLFWLYYPECRTLFARWTAVQTTAGKRISFEDLFLQRNFRSTIAQVSDMQGRTIAEGNAGLDALFESEEVRQQLQHRVSTSGTTRSPSGPRGIKGNLFPWKSAFPSSWWCCARAPWRTRNPSLMALTSASIPRHAAPCPTRHCGKRT
jgi:gliding motility associated protien GldN